MNVANPTVTDEEPEKAATVRRIAMASLIGTTIEWYDFLIYGALAGLIFNAQFFPSSDPLVSTLLAYGTFTAGFIARPIGGVIFGHYGDRIGRKPLLVLTLMLMGGATLLIGFLPNYQSIGIAAPVLLLILRVLQGLAMGGEWGGAVLMAYEYAPPDQRNYYASFPQIGLAIGLCASTGVLSILSWALTDQQFSDWGWRVAFILSIVLLAVGMFIRLRIIETPAFLQAKAREKVVKLPLVTVLKASPAAIVLGWGARLIDGVIFAVFALFTLTFLVKMLGMPRTTVLAAISTAAFFLIFTIPYASKIADRVGARRLYVLFSLILAGCAFPAFALMQTGNVAAVFACIVIMLGFLYAPVYGPQAGMFCELFQTGVRYTGISLIYQIGAIFSVSLTPVIATWLLSVNDNKPWMVAGYVVLAGVVSAICVALLPKPEK
jgi:MFS family permease